MLNFTDYDIITDLNITNDYNNITLSNWTINENNIGINIPTLLLTKPCGLSFFCLLSFIVCTIIKPLFNKK